MELQAPCAETAPTDLRVVLDQVETAGDGDSLRDEIVTSWERCALAGLRPDEFDVPYDADIDERGRLRWAAEAVIERVAADLDGTRIGLVLTDHHGQIVSRDAGESATMNLLDTIQLAPGFMYGEQVTGTNAIGTAIERRGPTAVAGHEHYAFALRGMACAAVTVTDPATGRVLGAVDLSCATKDASPLMLPLAKRAAWEIEHRLLEESTVDERVLQQHFLRARRSFRGALLALNVRTMLVNAAADAMFGPADRPQLWATALEVLSDPRRDSLISLAGGGFVAMRFEPLLDGTRLVGVLARHDAVADTTEAASPGSARANAATFGWDSLTDAELAVAEQVAQGLTNREVGARLYLSPHTVDFHLRQVYRKLDIRSRVALTRLIVQHHSH